LQLAKAIVNQDYVRLDASCRFSQELLDVISMCLQSTEAMRPNVTELIQVISAHVVA